MARVRMLRILEYVGEEEWIRKMIQDRSVKGSRWIDSPDYGECSIREAIVGDTNEILATSIMRERA